MTTITIRHQLSAAILPLDGFTGQPLGQRVLCELDGVPLARPVWKRDGWLILSDLAPGEHRLSLRCPSFQNREISLSGDVRTEIAVTLSPGAGYAFPPDTAFLFLTLSGSSDAQTQVFAGMPDPRQFKLMREAKAGDSAVKLFLRGDAPRSGWFLLGGKTTEAAFFRRVTMDGDAETASPLAQAHARGAALIPAQSFLVTAGEKIRIPFRDSGKAHLFCQGHLKTLALQAGEKRNLEWNLEA